MLHAPLREGSERLIDPIAHLDGVACCRVWLGQANPFNPSPVEALLRPDGAHTTGFHCCRGGFNIRFDRDTRETTPDLHASAASRT